MRSLFFRLARVLACLIGPGAGFARAADEQSFRAAAVGPTEEEAVKAAYYQGLVKALAGASGAQAEGDVGEQFKRDFDRDFNTFRDRYFTPDTDHRCQPKGDGRFTCEVTGTVKLLALQTDFRKVMKNTERTLSNTLTFAVSSAVKGAGGDYVVDKLTGAFTSSGYKVLSGSAVNDAIGKGKIDFSLAILEATYSPFAFDPAMQEAQGSLSIRFKLNDVKGKTQVAVLPVTVSTTVAGPALATVTPDLRDALAAKAAAEIGRQVNASVVTFQAERGGDAAASQRAASGGVLDLIRLEGIAQRDRDQIRIARTAISNRFPGTSAQVDPGQSNDTRVTLTLTSPRPIVPDDLLDVLYAANGSVPKFEATYAGNNEFIAHY